MFHLLSISSHGLPRVVPPGETEATRSYATCASLPTVHVILVKALLRMGKIYMMATNSNHLAGSIPVGRGAPYRENSHGSESQEHCAEHRQLGPIPALEPLRDYLG